MLKFPSLCHGDDFWDLIDLILLFGTTRHMVMWHKEEGMNICQDGNESDRAHQMAIEQIVLGLAGWLDVLNSGIDLQRTLNGLIALDSGFDQYLRVYQLAIKASRESLHKKRNRHQEIRRRNLNSQRVQLIEIPTSQLQVVLFNTVAGSFLVFVLLLTSHFLQHHEIWWNMMRYEIPAQMFVWFLSFFIVSIIVSTHGMFGSELPRFWW